MTRVRPIWCLAAVGWVAAALGVLGLGGAAGGAASCPLDGPWG